MRQIVRILMMTAAALVSGPAASSSARAGGEPSQRKLTLAQAVEMALQANLDIAMERLNVNSADAALQAARGSFDPVFRWQPSVGDFHTPVTSVLQGAGAVVDQHFAGQTASVRQKTGWNGLRLDAEFGNSRISSSNPFQSPNPFYSSQLAFTITQPLVRGRKIDPERALIRIRAGERDTSAAQLEKRAIEVVLRVEQAYWDLSAGRRQAEVAAEAVDLATAQLERNRRMIESGALPTVELAAAEAELQSRLDDLYRCRDTEAQFENAVKGLLARDRRESLWTEEIIPADRGAAASAERTEIGEAMETALRHRPELKALDAEKEVASVRTEHDADLVRPEINLTAEYALAGLAGRIRPANLPPILGLLPPLPAELAGGLGSSLSNLFGGNYPSVQAGITLTFTGRNRTAKANLAAAAIAERRVTLARQRTEQAIQEEVRNALQAIETAAQRMRAAEAGARAASVKLESESRMFAAGESTNFMVLTRQNEYSAARRRQVEADAAFNKATARYGAALGTSLSARGIEIAERP